MQIYISKTRFQFPHWVMKNVLFPKVIIIFKLIYLFWFKMKQTLPGFFVTRFTSAFACPVYRDLCYLAVASPSPFRFCACQGYLPETIGGFILSLVSIPQVYLRRTSDVNGSNFSVSRLLCSLGNACSSKPPKYTFKSRSTRLTVYLRFIKTR